MKKGGTYRHISEMFKYEFWKYYIWGSERIA